jgi:hypothetical protein
LLGLTEVIDVTLQYAPHALEVFALAHERIKFKPERIEIFRVVARDALVHQRPRQRIS